MGLLMGGTLAAKSVRHAFEVVAEIRQTKGRAVTGEVSGVEGRPAPQNNVRTEDMHAEAGEAREERAVQDR